MNAPRKKNVVALPDSPEMGGIGGAFQKHANTALTVLLLAAAAFMFVRWRMNTAKAARDSVAIELSNARTLVQELEPTRLPLYFPAEMIKHVTSIQNDANTAITNLLNNSDATVPMRAEAFTLRGDLYWELANLPPLPGSSTQPSLQLTERSDALLQKAADAYQEVIKNSTYADQHEQLSAAHFGLAAIAENHGDFKTAETELNAVKNDTNTLPVLQAQAQHELDALPQIQKKIYLAPPTGVGAVAALPTTAPVIGPPMPMIGPVAPVIPPAVPTTQFSLPSVLTLPPVVPATMP